MSAAQFALLLTFLSVIAIPLGTIVIRGSVRWSKLEAKLDGLGEDVKEIAISQLRVEDATDRRLRWLEENIWLRSRLGR